MLLLSTLALAGCFGSEDEQRERPEPPDISIWGAAAGGHLHLIEQHVEAGTDIDRPLRDQVPGQGGTPLHIAVLAGQTGALRVLIESGADLNAKARDADGGTPLHWTAALARIDAAQVLVDAGADVNSEDRNGFTPLDATLYEAEKNRATKLEIAELLRSKGAKHRDDSD